MHIWQNVSNIFFYRVLFISNYYTMRCNFKVTFGGDAIETPFSIFLVIISRSRVIGTMTIYSFSFLVSFLFFFLSYLLFPLFSLSLGLTTVIHSGDTIFLFPTSINNDFNFPRVKISLFS